MYRRSQVCRGTIKVIEGLLLLLELCLMVLLLRALGRISKNPAEKGLGFFAYHDDALPKAPKKAKNTGGYA
jgi:hypothetical protein